MTQHRCVYALEMVSMHNVQLTHIQVHSKYHNFKLTHIPYSFKLTNCDFAIKYIDDVTIVFFPYQVQVRQSQMNY